MDRFLAAIGILVLGGVVSPFFSRAGRPGRWAWAVLVVAGCGPALSEAMKVLLGGAAGAAFLLPGTLLGPLSLRLDPLSAFFAAAIAGVSGLSAVYAMGYLGSGEGRPRPQGAHLAFFSLLVAAMLLVVAASDAVAFLISWEAMSITSFLLVAFEHDRPEVRRAAFYYLVAMHAGAMCLVAGFLWLGVNAHGFTFEAMKAAAVSAGSVAAFVLLFLGFAAKAGLWGLHTWLPQAHPAAPSHVSGLMSGVMIKTGIYGILRTIDILGVPSAGLGYAVLILGLASALLGILHAMTQKDLKRLLAYSSIENVGIIALGIGLGMLGRFYGAPGVAALGFAAALFHVLNHALFKSLLFFGAGAVYKAVHTRDIEGLGGLIRRMPMGASLFLVGVLSISALPPFNGFAGEFLLYAGLLVGAWAGPGLFVVGRILAAALLAVVGGLALACFARTFGVVFLGLPRTEAAGKAGEVNGTMLLPMGILAALCLALGVFPALGLRLVEAPASILAGGPAVPAWSAEALGGIGFVAVLLFGVAGLLMLLRTLLVRRQATGAAPTWGCGYQGPTPRMQYTASSFTEPAVSLWGPLAGQEVRNDLSPDPFPGPARLSVSEQDRVATGLIDPVLRCLDRCLQALAVLQRGSTQRYILYMLAFLILLLTWASLGGGL